MLDELLAEQRSGPAAVTIGTFDGVHRGHRLLVGRTAELARERGLTCVVVTFSPRPDVVIAPARALPDICSLPERADRLRRAGADRVVVVPFNDQIRSMPAQRFARHLVEDLDLRVLCVGSDFALGHGRGGDVGALRAEGIEVVTVPLEQSRGGAGKVSSSTVRETIARGIDPERALESA